MIQSWENLVTDGWMDERTDWQDWFHRTLSDERQASKRASEAKYKPLQKCSPLDLQNKPVKNVTDTTLNVMFNVINHFLANSTLNVLKLKIYPYLTVSKSPYTRWIPLGNKQVREISITWFSTSTESYHVTLLLNIQFSRDWIDGKFFVGRSTLVGCHPMKLLVGVAVCLSIRPSVRH